MLGGRFTHENIHASNPLKNEVPAGWAFHYLTGGSVALTYPALFLTVGADIPADHLIPGLVFGLVTVALPWLVLYPAFGYGLFGVRAPVSSRPILAPTVEHAFYGLGIGVVLNLAF